MDKNLQFINKEENPIEEYQFFKENFTNWELKNLTQKIKMEKFVKKLKYSQF